MKDKGRKILGINIAPGFNRVDLLPLKKNNFHPMVETVG